MTDFKHSPGDRVDYRGGVDVVRRTATEHRRCYWVTTDITDEDASVFAVDRPTLDACDSLIKANEQI